MEATVMVQKRPAKESAIRAPMREVKLDVAEKLVRMLEAGTRGMLRSCVKYVIMLAWNPELANLSHTSFPTIAIPHQNNLNKTKNIQKYLSKK